MTKLLVALCNFANTPKRHDVIATLVSQQQHHNFSVGSVVVLRKCLAPVFRFTDLLVMFFLSSSSIVPRLHNNRLLHKSLINYSTIVCYKQISCVCHEIRSTFVHELICPFITKRRDNTARIATSLPAGRPKNLVQFESKKYIFKKCLDGHWSTQQPTEQESESLFLGLKVSEQQS